MSGPAIGGALLAVSVVEVDKLDVNTLSIIIKLQLSSFFSFLFVKKAIGFTFKDFNQHPKSKLPRRIDRASR